VFGKCDDGLLSALGRACGEVSVNESVRYRHGDDESHHPAVPPDAVAFASSTEEVQAIVRICAERHVPVIPFGTGTSLEVSLSRLHVTQY
jgi:D-lactate dehydrogenase (cytochrome)